MTLMHAASTGRADRRLSAGLLCRRRGVTTDGGSGVQQRADGAGPWDGWWDEPQAAGALAGLSRSRISAGRTPQTSMAHIGDRPLKAVARLQSLWGYNI